MTDGIPSINNSRRRLSFMEWRRRRSQKKQEQKTQIRKLEPKACFDHLIKTAKLIADTNPRGLIDFVRAILRPLQSEYLLGVGERGQDALPDIQSSTFFGDAVRSRMFTDDGMKWRGVTLEGRSFTLSLSRDTILPWAWSYNGYVSALATIGSSKVIADSREWSRASQGEWQQDSNHRVELWLPWGIGFVNGGNHSITAGILAGEGEISPDSVYDMSYLLDDLYSDGKYYFDTRSDNKVAAVTDVRRAAVFEIGRIMRDMNSPAFKSETEQAYARRNAQIV